MEEREEGNASEAWLIGHSRALDSNRMEGEEGGGGAE